MRKPDVDPSALRAVVERAVPGSDRPEIARTAGGTSTQVYRVDRGGRTFYLRVAETRDATLAPEAEAHNELRARSVRVPEVAYFDPFDAALERSVMMTTEIPGRSLAEHHTGVDVRTVLIEAGRDLAALGGIAIEGFGWIRRDRGAVASLEGETRSMVEFALGDLDKHLDAMHGLLQNWKIGAIRDVAADASSRFRIEHGHLAHGDFDATHIYHQDGRYTGIIDLGEIRGADRFYDLGHYALHDGEAMPGPTLPFLLKGFGENAPLPADQERRIWLWSVLIGVRALARSVDRPRTEYREYLVGAIRRRLAVPRP